MSHVYLGLSFLQIEGKYNLWLIILPPTSNHSRLDRMLLIDLNPVPLKPNMHTNYLRLLVKMKILI